MITCYAFSEVPEFAEGIVRDLRVRWALEEAGLPYRTRLVGEKPGDLKPAEYRAIQPFGQVPALEDGDLRLFESGAIVTYVAEKGGALLPRQQPQRAHVMQWMFAALNTVEMAVQELAAIDLFYPDQAWAKERRPDAEQAVRTRLSELAARMDGREYLVDTFSAADILMGSVLLILRHTSLLDEHPGLLAYKARCEARPAYQAARAAQLKDLGK
jgi:glutathione S-transferase